MSCNPISNLTGCLGPAAGGQANTPNMPNAPGWEAICQSFAKAAQQLLGSFAKSFVSIPPISLSYSGVRSVYGMSLEIAALIAAVLLMAQVIRTVLLHDGSAIAQGLIGVGKAALAFVLTLAAAATALRTADELTRWIITRSFGSPQALSARLAGLVSFDPSISASLVLLLALLGILLTVALWAQLLVRNVAVTVLVAVSPIAAAGQIAHATQQWWRTLVRATIQLIALKPVVALVFAVGLTMPAVSGTVERLLAGMLVLLLGGCAWPVMARASSVLEVHVSGGALAGGRGAGSGTQVVGGPPGGVDPAELSRVAEARTMAVIHEWRTGAAGPRPDAPALGRPRLPGSVRADIGAALPGSEGSRMAADGGAGQVCTDNGYDKRSAEPESGYAAAPGPGRNQ
jgi:hypothetical protein